MNRPEPIELENNLGPDAVTGEINRVPWMAYDVDEMDLYIAEKNAEIAELKQKLEDAKATHYAESIDAGMENRRLKRALWLAREWRAWCEGQFWFVINGDEPRDVYHLIVTKRIHRTPTEWIDYWYKVEQKCKAKAEEYR